MESARGLMGGAGFRTVSSKTVSDIASTMME